MRPNPRGFLKFAALGCLVLVGALGAAGFLGWQWFKKNGADMVNQAAVQTIDESELSARDKQRLKREISRVVQDVQDGKISLEDMARVLEEVSKSPVVAVASVWTLDEKYLQKADLTAEQKASMKLEAERYARGVYEGKINKDTVDKVLEPLTEPKGKGKRELKDSVTRQELDAAVAAMKQHADGARIPREKFDVDVVGELIAAVEKALKDSKK